MSKIEVNTVEPQCGTTLTLGASGDTVTLGSGASQSGFGRTGTVDWQTGSIKTATFTAANGEGYFANTTGGAFNLTLPSSPSAGNIVAVSDYANTFNTNNLTIARNGSNIEGAASDLVLNQQGVSISLVYVDATKGWIVVNAGNSSQGFGQNFICATGGTITEDGNFRIHTFTGPGTFTVCSVATSGTNNVVSYVVAAGGGSGGSMGGGGGGAGGFREYKSPVDAYSASPLDGNPGGTEITVTAQAYPITVGAGGTAPNPAAASAPDGSPSIFSTITSTGGGGSVAANNDGRAGGSGSGGGGENAPGPSTAGAGNTPPTSPAQGTPGGTGGEAPAARGAGGGGGAACAGSNGSGSGGAGGAGSFVVGTGFAGCNGESGPVSGARYFAGGGGGGFEAAGGSNGVGGVGGGGDAGPGPGGGAGNGQAGVANTGGGGGGGSRGTPGTNAGQLGGNGGSGIVILRYKFQ